jgi:hypothetical protein
MSISIGAGRKAPANRPGNAIRWSRTSGKAGMMFLLGQIKKANHSSACAIANPLE